MLITEPDPADEALPRLRQKQKKNIERYVTKAGTEADEEEKEGRRCGTATVVRGTIINVRSDPAVRFIGVNSLERAMIPII